LVWDLVLSEDAAQNFIFIADGANPIRVEG
jgi:hypothetical protein